MFDTLREAARIATWAPDEARELIARVEPTDDIGVARAAELLAKIGAVTQQWELAREMYDDAAGAWEAHDAARAAALRAIGRCLPLAAFTTDVDAIASEVEIVRRVFEEGRPAPVVQRAVTEIRRALTPRPITGVIERAFGLSPGEMAYVMAAAAPQLEADVLPVTGVDDWRELLGASSLDGEVPLGRAAPLVKETPALVAHPALVSRLLGRATVENPIGCTASFVTPGAAPANAEELARTLVVDRRILAGERVDQLAAIAARRELRVLHVRAQAASSLALAAAVVEAGLHGAIAAIDAEEWRHVKLPGQGPLFVIARRPIAGTVAISSGR
ncbi:MAG: hypothetical protein JO257_21510 [Deltaproteobacteria bacterium]|nr:hypothetical protein [Deltaproteobacteria bacterium]